MCLSEGGEAAQDWSRRWTALKAIVRCYYLIQGALEKHSKAWLKKYVVRAARIERGLDVEQRTLWIGCVWIDQEQESGFSSGNKMGKLEQKWEYKEKIRLKEILDNTS